MGEVVVVVIADELEPVEKAHGNLEAGVDGGYGDLRFAEGFECLCEAVAGGAKGGEDGADGTMSVVGGFGGAIFHIGGGERGNAGEEFGEALFVERMEVGEMADVVFGGPFAVGAEGEEIIGTGRDEVGGARGCAAEAFEERGKSADREIEREAAFAPGCGLDHAGSSVRGMWRLRDFIGLARKDRQRKRRGPSLLAMLVC